MKDTIATPVGFDREDPGEGERVAYARADGGQAVGGEDGDLTVADLQRDVPELDADVVFSTLSNERRRLALEQLLDAEGTVTVRELTTAVAAAENDLSEAELTYKQRKRVYTSLHQTHLPKLRSTGLVDYDSARGVVTPTDRLGVVAGYLRGDEAVGPGDGSEHTARTAGTTRPAAPLGDAGPRWCHVYLGLGAVMGLGTAGALAGLAPFTAVPDIAYGLGGACGLLGLAGYHAASEGRRRRSS